MAGLKRYGHCSVLLAPDVILTTGGFGDHGGRHCRLTELHILIKHQEGWRSDKVRLAELEMAWGKRQGWVGGPLGAGKRALPGYKSFLLSFHRWASFPHRERPALRLGCRAWWP